MSIPAEAFCDHALGNDPRRVGACVKCGRKLATLPALSVGEGIELLNLLYRNPAMWNRKLREKLEQNLGPQNIRP